MASLNVLYTEKLKYWLERRVSSLNPIAQSKKQNKMNYEIGQMSMAISFMAKYLLMISSLESEFSLRWM